MPLKQLTTSQDQNSIDKKVGKISENTIDLLRGTALKKLRRRNEINNIKTIIIINYHQSKGQKKGWKHFESQGIQCLPYT